MTIAMTFKAAALGVAGLLVLGQTASADTTIRLLEAWPRNTSMIANVGQKYIAAVEDASKGTIKFQTSGPEVVPPFEQLQPLSAGVFSMMVSTPAYHQAQSGVGAVIDGMLSTDPVALRASGVMDWVTDYYRKKFGLELLALVPMPANQLIMRNPLPEGKDMPLEGLKIRSNAAFEGIVRELGGAPVNLDPSAMYAAMEKGVIDGVAGPQHAAADYKMYEMGKYMTRPGYGHTAIIVMANSASFAALPEEVQATLREQGIALETSGKEAMAVIAEQQNARMKEEGVTETLFSESTSARLEAAFQTGILAVAQKSDMAAVDELVALAKSKDMLAK